VSIQQIFGDLGRNGFTAAQSYNELYKVDAFFVTKFSLFYFLVVI